MSFATCAICMVICAAALQLSVARLSLADTPQIDPKVEQLLKQSAAAYQGLKSYQHTEVMQITVQGPLGEQSQVQKCILALQRPNQFVYKCNMMGEQEETACDGKFLINYKSHFNTYTVDPAPSAYAGINLANVTYMSQEWMGEPQATCLIALLLQGDVLANKDMADILSHGKIGPAATVDGKKADTLICQLTAQITNTFYFDPATHLLLKAMQHVDFGTLVGTTTETLADVKVETTLADELFKYSPPTEARLAADFTDSQVDRNVEQLLKQSAAAYKKFKSYQHTEVMRVTFSGPQDQMPVEQKYLLAMKRPNRFTYKGNADGQIEVFCGAKFLTCFEALSKKYARIPAPATYSGLHIADAIFQDLFPHYEYTTLAQPQATCLIALLLQGDALAYKDETNILVNGKIGPAAMVNGKKANTLVCRYPGMPTDAFTLTFYFDATTHLLLKATLKECEEALMARVYLRQYASLAQVDPKRQQTVTVMETVIDVKSDIALTDDLFNFKPPADTKQVSPSAMGLVNHIIPAEGGKAKPNR